MLIANSAIRQAKASLIKQNELNIEPEQLEVEFWDIRTYTQTQIQFTIRLSHNEIFYTVDNIVFDFRDDQIREID